MSGISKALTLSLLAKKANQAGVTEPEYYFVIPFAGQSNATGSGEGQPLPTTLDAPHPRIKQLAFRSTTIPTSVGGVACAMNDIIPLDHCAHHVDDMSGLNHPSVSISAAFPAYGVVGAALHIAKKLLPLIPTNAGILMVPCARSSGSFTSGTDQLYSATTGAPTNSTKWGVTGGLTGNGGVTALYQNLRDRTRAALSKNSKNILLAVLWMQGEGDMLGTPANHKALFEAQVNQFFTDINSTHAAQCLGMNATNTPWICGDTTAYWKSSNAAAYTTIYETNYGASTLSQVKFVRFMTDETGANVPSNATSEDPDISASGYKGSASRSSGNWTAVNRPIHFSSWALRGIVAERMAAAVVQYSGRWGVLGSDRVIPAISVITGASLSGSTLTLTRQRVLDGFSSQQILAFPAPVASSINYAPSVSSIGYNGRRGNGTLLQQGFTGTLEYAANTTAIAGATVIDGAAANNANTLTSAITHPDGQGGFTYRHSVSAASNSEWYKLQTLDIAALMNLITYGGSASVRAKITDAYAAQVALFLCCAVHPSNSLVPAAASSGALGTNNSRLGMITNLIQAKLNGSIQSLYWVAAQNGGYVDLVNIPFDNLYHTYSLVFAGGNSNLVTPYIDTTAGAQRALSYSAATSAYANALTSDTTANFVISDTTTSLTLGFNLDQLQFIVYNDNGNIALQSVSATHNVSLQAYTRNHIITIPDFAMAAGSQINITAQNNGNVTVQGANNSVLIQPLGGTLPLPSATTITRTNNNIATYTFTQVAADGKTWVRTA